ncbi:hypothetical protein ABCY62_06180 [Acetivibrio clariflavus]|uniref:hypothetical protein n=1 Tax=Acetivibrio clariflavus TaxID=288965 RepID=UPI0031F58135
MKYYVRNSFTEICFNNEDIVVMGGKYNKKIKANSCVLDILSKTSSPIEEEKLLNHLEMKFKINLNTGKSLLLKLLNIGFLETNNIYTLNCIEQKTKDSTEIKSLNIPTYLRPKELFKCMKSYSDNFQKNSHYIDYYVFDDSPLDRSKDNYEILKKVKKDIRNDIFYIDLEEKEKFIDIIAKECGVEKRIIEFGFLPKRIFESAELFSTGANRNFIMAYTIGDCFLMADDDSCCLGIGNNSNSNIYFSSGRGNIKNQIIESKDLEDIKFNEELDILGYHEKYIGKPLKEILFDKKVKVITYDMVTPENNIFPNNYSLYENSIVHFTFNTIFGWPDQTADEVLYDYLENNNMDYLIGSANKTIFESAPGDIIYSNPFLLTSTLTGIDNRKSMCPFIPVYRNEDVHYGYFLNYLDPYILSVCINVSLKHDRKKSTNRLEAFFKNFYGDIVLSYVLYTCLNKLKIKIPKEYLDANIRKLVFSKSIKYICGKNRFDFTNNLLELKIDLHKLWHEKRALIDSIDETIRDSQFYLKLNECLSSFDKFINNDEWELIREVLILYSDLLAEWDSIMEVCIKLKEQGKLPRKTIKI